MSKTVLAELVTKMTIESAQFQKELEKSTAKTYAQGKASKKAANDSDAFGGSLKGMVGKLSSYKAQVIGSTAAIAAMGAALYANTNRSSANAKELLKLSNLSGESVENFQALAFAFSSIGVEQDKFADISKDVQDKLGDFLATGAGPFKDFFENIAPKVGLTADALRDLSSTDVLIAVKKAMDDVNVSAKEQVFYMESIANDATLLIPSLANGGKQIKELAGQYNELNLAISETDAQKLKEFSAETKILGETFSSLGNDLAIVTLPALEKFSTWLTDTTALFKATTSGEESLASLNAELKINRELLDRYRSDGRNTSEISQDISGILTKIQAIKDQSKFEQESSVSLDQILDGVFSNKSESVGGVGEVEAKLFAENTFNAIKEALAAQAEFEKESGELSGLLAGGLSIVDGDFTQLTEANKAEAAIKAAHYKQLENLKADWIVREKQLATSDFLSNLQIATSKSSKLNGIAKAAAIAQAVINTYSAANQALAAPFPPPVPQIFAAAAVAAGLANVAAIRSTPIAGARELGGPVSGGSTYLVGEKGPELFTANASGQITSNANLQKAVDGSGSASQTPEKHYHMHAMVVGDDQIRDFFMRSGEYVDESLQQFARS
jgi:hypothetical protein